MEDKTMYDPRKIVTWCEENFQSMRGSRRKTLAALVGGAMKMQGTGVLALGRAMQGDAFAKHRIKRVDRFLGNSGVEVNAAFSALFSALRGSHKRPVVLADWTDRRAYEQLVFALSKNGRALPFLWVTIKKADFEDATKGLKIQAEEDALALLKALCPAGVRPVIIADRGFGNARWLGQIQKWGWCFVQRLAKNHQVETTGFIGVLSELGIRRGWRPRDWGWGTLGEKKTGWMRLVTVYDREAKGPWYLVTNIEDTKAEAVVALYAKRMWIEAMFRDLKSRKWGLGIDDVKLTDAARTTRHFLVVAIAYILLCAIGAVAEMKKIARTLKANTVNRRTLALAAIGNNLYRCANRMKIQTALNALVRLPT
jgi:hypothetical protein